MRSPECNELQSDTGGAVCLLVDWKWQNHLVLFLNLWRGGPWNRRYYESCPLLQIKGICLSISCFGGSSAFLIFHVLFGCLRMVFTVAEFRVRCLCRCSDLEENVALVP